MAGDWIKMRGALLDHPKVIAITRVLLQTRSFRDWLAPGAGADMSTKVVSDPASRAVTTALLLRAWSAAREHGKFIADDLWLEHSWVEDMDQLGGAPGLGLAMEAVGWVKAHPTSRGIILPNFKEFNVPMTEAERAKGYRDRKKHGVTEPSQDVRDEKPQNVTPRVEKRRTTSPSLRSGEDARAKVTGKGTPIPSDFGISEAVRKWAVKRGFAPFLELHLEHFRDYCSAADRTTGKDILAKDWDAKFRTCIASDWGGVRAAAQKRPGVKGLNGTPRPGEPWYITWSGIKAEGERRDLPYVEGDDAAAYTDRVFREAGITREQAAKDRVEWRGA